MSEDDLVNLVDFGLTVLQAKAYLALLRFGSGPASQISSAIGTVRPETYRVLRELALKGMVERSPGSPALFTAVHPDRAIPTLLAGFQKKVVDLRKKHDSLIASLGTYESFRADESRNRFGLTFTTPDNVEQRHIFMIRQVRKDYAAVVGKFGLRLMGGEEAVGDDFVHAIIKAKRRGVRIRMISEIDESNLKHANFLVKYVELRKSNDILFYINIFDKREMIIGPSLTDEEFMKHYTRDADLWTNNSRFIRGMYTMFEKLWAASSKYVPTPVS